MPKAYCDMWQAYCNNTTIEPRYEKTGKLISAFVFATYIEQSLSFLNTKFQASNHFLWLYSRGVRYYRYTDKPRCGLEKIRIAIRFGRIGSLGNLR